MKADVTGDFIVMRFPKTGKGSENIEIAESEDELALRVPIESIIGVVASVLYQLYRTQKLQDMVGSIKASMMYQWAKEELKR